MKLKNVQTPGFRIRGYAVAFTGSLCLLFCFSPERVGAQKAQKRITSVWTATGADGSRVILASDRQLNDYEAYTRGDRFYVKIPQADLPTTAGSLLGRGFDDVQIHRVGDGLLLSFRLQPGTTARVEQKLNRLEVVFSIPVRSQSFGLNADRNEVANRTRARTIRDAAGPTPSVSARENQTRPGSPRRHAERGERTTGSGSSENTRLAGEPHRGSARISAGGSSRAKSLREKSVASSLPRSSSTAPAKQPGATESPSPANSSGSKGSTTKGAVASVSPLPSPSSTYSPSPVASPSSSSAAASPSGTPLYAAPVAPQASASPTPASISAPKSDWSGRLHYAKTWVRLNPWPLVIAGLVFVALLLLLFVRGGRRRRRTSDNVYGAETPARPATTPPATLTASTNPQPVSADAARAAAGQRGVGTSSESSSSPATQPHASTDPDREVFEI